MRMICDEGVYEIMQASWSGEKNDPSAGSLMFIIFEEEKYKNYRNSALFIDDISKEKANEFLEALYETGHCDVRGYEINY